MRLSSLFKDKAYVLPHNDGDGVDYSFISRVLTAIRPRFNVSAVTLLEICDHYDVFLVREKKRGVFKLKISLSDPDKILKREGVALRSTKDACTPQLIDMGNLTIGEEITYSLTYVGEGESLRDMGRGPTIALASSLFDCYFTIANTRSVGKKYGEILNCVVAEWDMEKTLPTENLHAFQEYTNYEDTKKFLNTLKKETLTSFSHLGDFSLVKCHGNLSLDSIFCDGANFYFDSLSNVSMGHPFI